MAETKLNPRKNLQEIGEKNRIAISRGNQYFGVCW